MGAASSFPSHLSKAQAQELTGEAWATVEAQWPGEKEVITREELEALVAAGDEAVLAACAAAPAGGVVDVDELPVGPAGAAVLNKGGEAPSEQPEGAVEAKKKKVEVAKRDEFDLAAKRRAKIAAANGVDVKAVGATPVKARKPPKAPGSSVKKSAAKEQSAQLRALLKSQRAAAKAEGRPPSRGMDEVECMLYVKPSDATNATKDQVQVMTLGESDDPEVLQLDSCANSEGTPSVGLPAGSESLCLDEAETTNAPARAPANNAPKAAPPVVAAPPAATV